MTDFVQFNDSGEEVYTYAQGISSLYPPIIISSYFTIAVGTSHCIARHSAGYNPLAKRQAVNPTIALPHLTIYTTHRPAIHLSQH
jgi:hypothetical protein